MIIDFAERAHNHNWDLDPVVRSLLDTDFYKLLMLQFIWKHFPTTQVSFSVSNRSSSIRLADVIAREEVLEQLEHVRSLRFLKSELIWLAGNTFFWPARYLRAGLPGVAGPRFSPFQLSPDRPRWRISPGVRRALDGSHDVGDLCPLHPQ